MSDSKEMFESFFIYKNKDSGNIVLEIPETDKFESVFGKINTDPKENQKIHADPIEIFLDGGIEGEEEPVAGIAFWRANDQENN